MFYLKWPKIAEPSFFLVEVIIFLLELEIRVSFGMTWIYMTNMGGFELCASS